MEVGSEGGGRAERWLRWERVWVVISLPSDVVVDDAVDEGGRRERTDQVGVERREDGSICGGGVVSLDEPPRAVD